MNFSYKKNPNLNFFSGGGGAAGRGGARVSDFFY